MTPLRNHFGPDQNRVFDHGGGREGCIVLEDVCQGYHCPCEQHAYAFCEVLGTPLPVAVLGIAYTDPIAPENTGTD